MNHRSKSTKMPTTATASPPFPPARHAFSVDVEDYYHVSAFEKVVSRADWEGYASRVAGNTERLLELLDRHGVRATFFVLGWVAERHPRLVRAIHRRGHEIGCHGYWHRLVYSQSPAEFRSDLVQGRDVLQDLIGEAVVSYRAPSFSIVRRSWWALEILADEGFRIDSSIVPARHDRYGVPGAPRQPHRIDTDAGPIWEVSPAVVRLGPLALPVGGGGYFRLFPLWWTFHCLRGIERRGLPIVFYVHPWEIDPDQPRIAGASLRSRFRHYVHLSSTAAKLDRLLGRFRFGRLAEVAAAAGGTDAAVRSTARHPRERTAPCERAT